MKERTTFLLIDTVVYSEGEQRIYLNAECSRRDECCQVGKLMNQHTDKPEPVYLLDCPLNRPAYLQHGRFGWYIQVGNDEKQQQECWIVAGRFSAGCRCTSRS